MDGQKLFGKRIKELRKQRKLTQEQLSEMLGVFQKQIGNIETGTTFTTMNNLEKLAEILGVEVSGLFEYNHQKPRQELIGEIISLVNQSTDEDIRTIYRIIKAVVR